MESNDPSKYKEQNSLIVQLTAQLQSINWLFENMDVKMEELMNDGLIFNITCAAKLFKEYQKIINIDELQKTLNENTQRKNINTLYFMQLIGILKNAAKYDEYYESVVQKVEEDSEFDTYSACIQALMIPHTLGLESNIEDENVTLDETIEVAKQYITIMSTKHNRRLLRGIKYVKDLHEYIDLTCLDPEIPEEYSARAILQLTQGYLFLYNMQ